MKEIKLGLIGTGTVGGGVIKILDKQIAFFKEQLGLNAKLYKVGTRDEESLKSLPLEGVICVDDGMNVATDPEVDVVIELMGGTTFARDFVMAALENGKHVITANKALIAKFGDELFALASEKNVSLYFEAAVGGGMPSIKTIREAMVGNEILSVQTIINGTCNYILTEMTEKGAAFDPTLKTAQELGFAEADPTLDIEGGDTGHKTAIIASLVYGGYVSYDDMSVRGITSVTSDDIKAATELGYSIKLLGVVKRAEGETSVDVRVNPVLVHKDNIIAAVNGVFNTVVLEGDAVGPIMLYGAGAGEMPTASAVISDVVDVLRNIKADDATRIPMSFYNPSNKLTVKGTDEIESRFYLRFSVADEAGVMGAIADKLGDAGISIASITQKEETCADGFIPVIITTDSVIEAKLRDAVAAIESNDFCKKSTQILHIED